MNHGTWLGTRSGVLRSLRWSRRSGGAHVAITYDVTGRGTFPCTPVWALKPRSVSRVLGHDRLEYQRQRAFATNGTTFAQGLNDGQYADFAIVWSTGTVSAPGRVSAVQPDGRSGPGIRQLRWIHRRAVNMPNPVAYSPDSSHGAQNDALPCAARRSVMVHRSRLPRPRFGPDLWPHQQLVVRRELHQRWVRLQWIHCVHHARLHGRAPGDLGSRARHARAARARPRTGGIRAPQTLASQTVLRRE